MGDSVWDDWLLDDSESREGETETVVVSDCWTRVIPKSEFMLIKF